MSAEQGDVETIREALDDMNYGHEGDAYASLTALTTQIEELERERADLLAQWSDYKATTEDVIEAAEGRAEKAERALGEILNELGVPDENYAAPVANAVEIARAALRPSEKASDES